MTLISKINRVYPLTTVNKPTFKPVLCDSSREERNKVTLDRRSLNTGSITLHWDMKIMALNTGSLYIEVVSN